MAVILPSVYEDGTATVAANGTAVTGQGTVWLNTILPGDWFGAHKGCPTRILSVNSNTSLTLANPYLGGAQTAAAYAIMYQGDNARMSETARQLLTKLMSGNIEALAGLTGADETAPYFTGPGAMALMSARAKGRTLLAAADTNAALTALGPVFGGQSPQPVNAGVGMANGNFNTLIYPGMYTVASDYLNGPSGAGTFSYSGMVDVRARTGGAGIWQHVRLTSQAVWRRYSPTTDGSSWGAWERIENPTVGTVSQTGGVPTGAIIEYGSNANGHYTKWADGTQMCWIRNTVITAGTPFVWTYPAAFNSATTISATICPSSTSSPRTAAVLPSAATAAANVWTSSSGGEATSGVNIVAIGRWYLQA